MIAFWIERLQDYLYHLDKKRHPLRLVSLEVTRECNLQCRHCYACAENAPSRDELRYEEICQAVDSIRSTFRTGVQFAVTGGEPLVRTDIGDILRHIKSQGFRSGLVTNGLLLTQEKLDVLEDTVDAISISLDGFEESHNYLRGARVFDRTLDALRLCAGSGKVKVGVKTAVYGKNLGELSRLADLLEQLGVSRWHLFPVEPLGRGKEQKDLLLSEKECRLLRSFVSQARAARNLDLSFSEEERIGIGKKICYYCTEKRCRAGVTSLAILYNGDIVSCVNGSDHALDVQGNVRDGEIAAVWEDGFTWNRSPEFRACSSHYVERI